LGIVTDRDPARVGLHRNVLDQLGMLIVSGSITPGEVLLIEQLESRFAVSKSVIREAVRVLESMGLVSSRRRVGVTVLVREHWNVFDPRIIRWRLGGDDRDSQLRSLGGLRRGVEPVAAALAAQRATPEQCGELMRAVMEMAIHAKSGDLQAYVKADIAFHRTILEASGNEMLRALAPLVAEVLTGRTRLHLMPSNPNPLAVRLHADVAQAIQGGDAVAAETAMREIVEEATQAMLAGGDGRVGAPLRPDGDPPVRVGAPPL
jgi:DNA-binding FadR family transcriptional regulator